MRRQPLTDDVCADLLPSLTSTTLVAFHPRDLKRDGTPEARLAARQPPADEDLFPEQVLAASEDVPTQRITRTRPGTEDATPLMTQRLEEATPAAGGATGRRKPTDSFTLNPEFAQRVFDSVPIEVIDPTSGDHIAFVRGQVHRDAQGRVVKIQCYLPRGRYLGPPGARLACRIGGERWRVRDGFYVTPRGGRGDEWMYLGYCS